MATIVTPASLWVRLAALFYDSLLVFGLWVGGTFALLPFTGGKAIAANEDWYFIYLFGLVAAFYLWFWRKSGATLGMQAWRLQLRCDDEQRIDWSQAMLRLVVAWLLLGTGFVWCLFDARRRAVHDLVARTEVVRLPKAKH
ncbi:RDD family protein [bacterium]|nr:RDD family protein [bacterium]